jgi:glutamate carboxypeptidase
MTDLARRLLNHFQERLDPALVEIARLVSLETPSRDKARLDACAGYLRAIFLDAGAQVELLENAAGGAHVEIVFPTTASGGSSRAPALVLGHYDTVWPVGTLATMPVRRDGDQLFGPGIYDMKASLILLAEVFHAWRALALLPPRPVIALVTSDEEIGSPTSCELIEEAARRSAYALVLEAPLADGRLKTSRKGVGQFTLTVHGRAAHAGVEPEKGASAVVELAHQILAVSALADTARGTTVTVGTIEGGTTVNTVPELAQARIDLRVETPDEAERVRRALLALERRNPDTRIEVEGSLNRPMVRTERSAALFHQAQAIGRELDIELGEGSTGGGSDGNFTAAVGTPTLDGLGPRGAGAHASHEHIFVSSVPERAALLATLLLRLHDPSMHVSP